VAFVVPNDLNAQTTIYWKKDYITDGSGATIAVATPVPSDTTAPEAPTNLSATSTTTTSVALSWTASSSGDVVGNVIYRGAIPVGAVSGTTYSFTDVGLLPYTGYNYKLSGAHDKRSYGERRVMVSSVVKTALALISPKISFT
jgi:hypothetical protein